MRWPFVQKLSQCHSPSDLMPSLCDGIFSRSSIQSDGTPSNSSSQSDDLHAECSSQAMAAQAEAKPPSRSPSQSDGLPGRSSPEGDAIQAQARPKPSRRLNPKRCPHHRGCESSTPPRAWPCPKTRRAPPANKVVTSLGWGPRSSSPESSL